MLKKAYLDDLSVKYGQKNMVAKSMHMRALHRGYSIRV